jgi:hypothetical protein
MSKDKRIFIDYEAEINKAVLHILKQILKDASINGLRGEHHFYIKISTLHIGFRIEDLSGVLDEDLLKKYPKEITIVLQNAFEKLTVEKDHFSVVLNFNSVPRKIIVPFNALMAFHDPFANFAVHLEQKNQDDEESDDDDEYIEFEEYEGELLDDEDDELARFLEYDYNIYKSAESEKVVCLDDIRAKLKKV